MLCNNLMVPRGKDGGMDSQGVWDEHGHTAVFNKENQQGPAVFWIRNSFLLKKGIKKMFSYSFYSL